jgi:hypothetical protein
MSEWQPIETAPKNPEGKFYGPRILVYCTADGLPWPAYWGQAYKTDDATNGTWYCCDDASDNNEFGVKDISHWMPLPTPPKDNET